MNENMNDLFGHEQYRIRQLQVFNWGTFSNLHDIHIAERGFLFVGRSGSGKSTLLDAFSALLVPPKWLDFNAAAREADRSGRDRNLVTYVRGAWAEQKDNESGHVATQYLRTGTTWSALALSYRNVLGKTVVLVQLFWLRGNSNNNADVHRHYFIFERPFDLRELQNFDLNIRNLKLSLPDTAAFDEFRPYCERFRRLLGIESDMALRLLHKTQSAKNLGDLNTFLRDFMLDKPVTFDVAERLVTEFSELSEAHQAVVTAREQVQVLSPAQDEYQSLQKQQLEKNALENIKLGIDGYRESCRKNLLEQFIKTLATQNEGLAGEMQQKEKNLNNQILILRDLEQQHNEMGGNQIAQWEAEQTELEKRLAERLRKKELALDTCSKLNWTLPDSPHDFAELVGTARQELENGQALSDITRAEQFNLVNQRENIEKEFALIRKEVQALKRQPSNIPAEMLELRGAVSSALGLHESALPFIGELIEIRPQETQWQGAIERVLRGFALSLLIEDSHYTSLSNYINTVNLRKKLVYFRMGQIEWSQNKSTTHDLLIHKLTLKEGKYFAWLQVELTQRFNYTCVESLQAFRNTDKALTREGQIRHSKTRHEKDDRWQVDDRINWVLGFDNREKLTLCEQRAQTLADTLSQLNQKIDHLTEKDKLRASRSLLCQILANMQWQEIDVTPLTERMAAVKEQLRTALNSNTLLKKMSERIEQQRAMIEKSEKQLRETKVKYDVNANQIKENQEKLLDLQNTLLAMSLTSYQINALAERFAELPHQPTLKNLDDLTRSVERKLSKEIETLVNECNTLDKSIEIRFAEFKRKWPLDASDVDATLASAPDFFAKLQRLRTDRLPEHEERFFKLLKNQSHQNLAALSTHLSQARKAISERMALVNESLSQAPFNPGTYLYIDATDKQLPEVRDFRQQIQQALSHAWTEDREHAEARFAILQQLVEKLGSNESEQKRWRESVLDVRLHVEFIGRERDQNNHEVEIHRSGAGKSGGQRQKLATTCLAAALRYQLGGNDHHLPVYAPVILDEAFDKADNEFTALAMNIFANFGFQMIVATPLKSVMTLEPFIGGACFVDISDRRHSGVLLIEYDDNQQRLKLPEHTYGDVKVS